MTIMHFKCFFCYVQLCFLFPLVLVGQTWDFTFYDKPVSLTNSQVCELRNRPKHHRYTYREINKRLNKLHGKNYVPLIAELKKKKQLLHLNDWAYYKLVERAVLRYFPTDTFNICILTFFLLEESGYDVALLYNSRLNRIGCYARIVPKIDYRNHKKIAHEEYAQLQGHRCYGCRAILPIDLDWRESDTSLHARPIDLRFSRSIELGGSLKSTQLVAVMPDSTAVEVHYNPRHTQFYDDYPFTSLEVYFNTPWPLEAQHKLKEQFLPQLEGKSLLEKANWLLRFIQFAYKYETDQKQFGHEKYNFPEESLYYTTTDCDDRSILLAALYRLLIPELEVIGVDLPEHVCCGVSFPTDTLLLPPAQNDYVLWHGKRFFIADPTYIGSVIGQGMPIIHATKAKVIPVDVCYSAPQNCSITGQ